MTCSFRRKNKTDTGKTWRVSKMNNYQVYQKFCDIFCFAYISALENDKFIIFFLRDAP